MLQINQIKNVATENITFSANTLILLKVRTNENSSGSIDTTINYIEVCELKDTKEQTLIESLLKFCLAEFRVSKGFENDYKDTNIKQRRILQPFLNTNVLFRTDSNGKISRALVSEINFNKTALNIRMNHTIVNTETKNLKAAIYQHSKAILAQCSYLSMIGKEVESIINLCTTENVTVSRTTKTTPKIDAKAA